MLDFPLRVLGMLWLLGAATGLVICAVLAAIALVRHDRKLLGRAGGAALGIVALHAILVAAGPLLTRQRTLGPGEELAFCGLDCHLHVSVAGVRRAGDLEVMLHLRSDAKQAPEYPSYLRVRVVDSSGAEYAPSAPLDGPLAAGEARDEALRFAVPAGARAPHLVVSWGSVMDYLVPGPSNALVQRKRRIRLDAEPALGVRP